MNYNLLYIDSKKTTKFYIYKKDDQYYVTNGMKLLNIFLTYREAVNYLEAHAQYALHDFI